MRLEDTPDFMFCRIVVTAVILAILFFVTKVQAVDPPPGDENACPNNIYYTACGEDAEYRLLGITGGIPYTGLPQSIKNTFGSYQNQLFARVDLEMQFNSYLSEACVVRTDPQWTLLAQNPDVVQCSFSECVSANTNQDPSVLECSTFFEPPNVEISIDPPRQFVPFQPGTAAQTWFDKAKIKRRITYRGEYDDEENWEAQAYYGLHLSGSDSELTCECTSSSSCDTDDDSGDDNFFSGPCSIDSTSSGSSNSLGSCYDGTSNSQQGFGLKSYGGTSADSYNTCSTGNDDTGNCNEISGMYSGYCERVLDFTVGMGWTPSTIYSFFEDSADGVLLFEDDCGFIASDTTCFIPSTDTSVWIQTPVGCTDGDASQCGNSCLDIGGGVQSTEQYFPTTTIYNLQSEDPSDPSELTLPIREDTFLAIAGCTGTLNGTQCANHWLRAAQQDGKAFTGVCRNCVYSYSGSYLESYNYITLPFGPTCVARELYSTDSSASVVIFVVDAVLTASDDSDFVSILETPSAYGSGSILLTNADGANGGTGDPLDVDIVVEMWTTAISENYMTLEDGSYIVQCYSTSQYFADLNQTEVVQNPFDGCVNCTPMQQNGEDNPRLWYLATTPNYDTVFETPLYDGGPVDGGGHNYDSGTNYQRSSKHSYDPSAGDSMCNGFQGQNDRAPFQLISGDSGGEGTYMGPPGSIARTFEIYADTDGATNADSAAYFEPGAFYPTTDGLSQPVVWVSNSASGLGPGVYFANNIGTTLQVSVFLPQPLLPTLFVIYSMNLDLLTSVPGQYLPLGPDNPEVPVPGFSFCALQLSANDAPLCSQSAPNFRTCGFFYQLRVGPSDSTVTTSDLEGQTFRLDFSACNSQGYQQFCAPSSQDSCQMLLSNGFTFQSNTILQAQMFFTWTTVASVPQKPGCDSICSIDIQQVASGTGTQTEWTSVSYGGPLEVPGCASTSILGYNDGYFSEPVCASLSLTASISPTKTKSTTPTSSLSFGASPSSTGSKSVTPSVSETKSAIGLLSVTSTTTPNPSLLTPSPTPSFNATKNIQDEEDECNFMQCFCPCNVEGTSKTTADCLLSWCILVWIAIILGILAVIGGLIGLTVGLVKRSKKKRKAAADENSPMVQ